MNLNDLPAEVLSEVTQRAITEGMLPKPDGFDSSGRPTWLLSTMASWFGHSESEAREILEGIGQERGINPFVDPRTIHRIQ